VKAAILTVGNELLGGYTLDTNSTWIGRKLMDIGIPTKIKMSVGDSKQDILEALSAAKEKADVIICTGGLGPTNDDVTRSTFCEFIDAQLEFDEVYYKKLVERFERRGLEMPESNREQAYLPNKGDIIPNPKGSALGIHFHENEKRYYVLPGVPSEMKEMMEQTVLPNLISLNPGSIMVHTIRSTGIMESSLYDLISDLNEDTDVDLSFIPGFMGVDIRLTSRNSDSIMELSSEIYNRAGNYIYAENWETLEEVVGRLLRERGLTIATAESCTGGLMSDRLTNVPGSSDYFLGGIVSYSNEAKISLLGVTNQTLMSEGAVSEKTATEMARGVRTAFQADIGVSITGIAGPSGETEKKPIGLTYIGFDYSGEIETKQFIFSKDRRYNKELAAQAALNIVRLGINFQS